ncbi:hypothetical protein HanIR_Chr11g0531461 [Helianthus annuus]|nr:hypothetical protein HanIR_Chr11g0531461 [Helianthus annuus]
MRRKYVDKSEQLKEKVKMFDKSTLEVGETSKRFYKRRADENKQKWVVKSSESSSDNESDSIKSEESFVEKKNENSVPELNDENFPPLRAENLKSKGRFEISDQFFAGKKEFDTEKMFNGKVKHIFGKMVDGKVKGAKEFYKSKCWWDRCVPESPKAGQAWGKVFPN